MSEIETRADEIRKAAETCGSIRDLALALSWPIQSAAAANDQLGLGLPWIKIGRKSAPHVPRELPKPKKGAKA